MDTNAEERLDTLERAVAELADALMETVELHRMGWTQWRADAVQAKVRAARAAVAGDTITIPEPSASVDVRPPR